MHHGFQPGTLATKLLRSLLVAPDIGLLELAGNLF
jgi:hypothetical protein